MPANLLELAERVSAKDQAGARSMALNARCLGARPQRADGLVRPSWPVFSNLSPAPTVNRLNESGSPADLAGVSEPFEQSVPADPDGRDGLDHAADQLDEALGDELRAVFQLDSYDPASGSSPGSSSGVTADASGYDASLGYGTDGDFGTIDDFGAVDEFGAVDGAADYGVEYGGVSFEAGPDYAGQRLHDVSTPGLAEPISHQPSTPGLAPPLEEPIAHVVTTPGLAPSLAEPAGPDASHTADPVATGITSTSLAAMLSATPGQQIAPSPGRPQLSSMIDQLREGFRLGKHRLDGPRHTPDHPVVAETTGLPGNSAIFASPGEEGSSPIEGAAWSSVLDPDGYSATATLEAERTMTTVTEPITDSNEEQAGLAGPAAEGPDTVDSDGISTDGGNDADDADDADDAQEPSGGEMTALSLANTRATTIVPNGRSRSRWRSKNVPAQRLPVEDEPVLVSDAEPAAPAVIATTGPDDVDELTGAGSGAAAESSYAGADASPEADDELLGQPELDEPVEPIRAATSGSAVWRMLRKLRPRRRPKLDDEDLWIPETDPADDQHDAGGEHWTHSDEYSAEYAGAGQPEPAEPDTPADAGRWSATAVHRLEPPSFGDLGIFGQPTGSDRSGQGADTFVAAPVQRASAAGLHPAEAQDRLAMDREALRTLGVPAAWTRQLQAGDRFASILAMLERLPQLEISDDVGVIAVVGPAEVVELEAHRTALDLPAEGRPRAVAAVPGQAGADRRSAVAQSKRTRPVVVAIAVQGYDDPAETRKVIAAVKAESVIAIVDSGRPLEETARWIEALESVDAIALDGALDNDRPAQMLTLEVPVIRMDGIAVDRIGWTALLCAQLTALDLQRDSIHQ